MDHMTLAWSKHLYTPFDKYVDSVKEKGVIIPPPPPPPSAPPRQRRSSSSSKQRRSARRGRRPPPAAAVRAYPQHVFHRMYVQDKAQEESQQQGNKSNHHHHRRRRQTAQQKGSILRSVGDVTYRFPFQRFTLLRALVLVEVEALMRLEHFENHLMRRKMDKKDDSCC